MERKDVLIVGQGLAGTVLAHELLGRGFRIGVVDEGAGQQASRVAAGIFNPITGRKMVKTWWADALFPEVHRFYPELQPTLGAIFFHPLPILVPFDSQEKQNDWLAASADAAYTPYISGFVPTETFSNMVQGEYGGMLIDRGGYVDIPTFLDASRAYFRRRGVLVEGPFAHADLQWQDDGAHWNGIEVANVVFCEGQQALGNPYFDWLPFRPVKGELLEIRLGQPLGQILNRGCWVLPTADGTCRAGATYDNHYTDAEPTEAGRSELETRLRALLKIPYDIVAHRAGIRPATYDRRPFVGAHPKHPRAWVFNGLGAKGVSLAPYFANILAQHIAAGNPIPEEVGLGRVLRKFPELQRRL